MIQNKKEQTKAKSKGVQDKQIKDLNRKDECEGNMLGPVGEDGDEVAGMLHTDFEDINKQIIDHKASEVGSA